MDSSKQPVMSKVNLGFYKNPVFWFALVYVTSLVATFVTMDRTARDNYFFGSQFRTSSNELQFSKMLFYPYGTSSVSDILLTFTTSPPFMYLLVVTITVLSFVDLTKKMSYFYAMMYSFIVLFVLFVIHSVVINLIIGTENLPVEPKPEQDITYSLYYKTKWISTAVLSPIYIMIIVFLARLGK